MPEIMLEGCRPEPLMSYLKALGIFRLVCEQADRSARGSWRHDTFVLQSSLDKQALIHFFSEQYTPTPVVGPWAGGSGFFDKDYKEAVSLIAASETPRLAPYRSLIKSVRTVLDEEGIEEKPSELEKKNLLRRYRRELPDDFVQWMDCALVIKPEGQSFPPLLGTGGNDGRLDFTQNFMQRLTDVGLHKRPGDLAESDALQNLSWLDNALFARASAGLLAKAVGQFSPGGVGGPNATQGMEGGSSVNPWDFVLMIEGTLVMAGSVSRRMGAGNLREAAFPFTVAAAQAGDGSLDVKDPKEARGEIWLPLWAHQCTFTELRFIFSEGRAELSGKQSKDGVQFARAVSSMGVDRGLSGFARYSFLKRSGKAYLASPTGRFEVTHRPTADLLRDLDRNGWLDRFRRACAATNPDPPQRFPASLRRLDSTVLEYCRYGGKPRFAAILRALGRVEREIALLSGKVGGRNVNPVPFLSHKWIAACDDGSPEFRIAAALAGIGGKAKSNGHENGRVAEGPRGIGPLRCSVEPVEYRPWGYLWSEKDRNTAWSTASLSRNLFALLDRRLMDAARKRLPDLPINSTCSAGLDDLALFLAGETDDRRIEDYLWGLILVDSARYQPAHAGGMQEHVALPRTYALLKLIFLPANQALRAERDGRPLRPEPSVLALLRGGNLNRACDTCRRRLRASGFIPMPGRSSSGTFRVVEFTDKIDPQRLGAALLIPLKEASYLKSLVLRPARQSKTEI